jgi:diguanylate cyclase (GGDEF)-like protein
MRKVPWILSIAMTLLALSLSNHADSQPAPLTSIPDIRALTPVQAGQGLPVQLEGTVTFVQPKDSSLFIQENGHGIYVDFDKNIGLQLGDHVAVTGKTVSSFKTDVTASNVQLLGHGKLPDTPDAGFADLIDSKFDGVLVKVRGRVISATRDSGSVYSDLRFHLKVPDGMIEGEISYPGALSAEQLLDAEVEMTGVAGGAFDSKMQMGGVWLDIDSPDQVKILHLPATDAWSTPTVPLDQVIHAYRLGDASSRVRISGTLTYFEPGSVAVIENNGQSMLLNTGTTEPIQAGTEVEAIGFPEITDDSVWMNHAQLRSLKQNGVVKPRTISWGDATQGKFAYDLVSMEGQIVGMVHDSRVDLFIIQAEGHLFSATLRHSSSDAKIGASAEVTPENGSRVRVTGICFMDPGNHWRDRLWFDVRMRSLNDIAVVEPPSWWTVRRLSYAVTILSVVILIAVIWAGLLDRRLRRQTEVLARQSQEDAIRERRRARQEQQRSRILELISSSEPLQDVLKDIQAIVTTRLLGARSWIELPSQSAEAANAQPSAGMVTRTLMSPDGTVLGYLHAIPQPRATSPQEVEDAMAAGACLAELAIDTRRLYTDLRRRSEFDLLTDVPNRFSMERKLDQLMLAAKSSREAFGLIYVDLDRFKDVNDQYGHRIGDLYLTEVTRRMKLQLRSHDFLARIGGDEFIALTPVSDGRADAEEIAMRLLRSFEEPFLIEGIQIFGGASVGLAIYPDDGVNKEDLQKAADAAMYADKESKRPNRRGQSRVAI